MKSSVGFLGSNLNLPLLCRFSLSFAPKVLSVACQKLTAVTHVPETMPDESHARLKSTAMIYTNLLMLLVCVDHHLMSTPDTGWKVGATMGLDKGEEGEEEEGSAGRGRAVGKCCVGGVTLGNMHSSSSRDRMPTDLGGRASIRSRHSWLSSNSTVVQSTPSDAYTSCSSLNRCLHLASHGHSVLAHRGQPALLSEGQLQLDTMMQDL